MNFPKEEIENILDSLVKTLSDERSKLIYRIIIETSCKTSELSDIRLEDIQTEKIKFGKRFASISSDLSDFIKSFIQNHELKIGDYLFSTRQSKKISSKRIRQIIHQTSLQKLGYKIDPKDLRKYSIQKKLKFKKLEEIKKEVGLKRLDKREFLSEKEIESLERKIADEKTLLIFKLLLRNFKSSNIANFKVEDILDSRIPKNLARELESYAIKSKVSFGETLFRTRKKTPLSKITIFKLIRNISKISQVEVNPRILNNTCLARALSSEDSINRLREFGVKTRAFHLQGGFIKNG